MSVQAIDIRTRRFVEDMQDFARLLIGGWVGLREAWHFRRQILEAMLEFGVKATWIVSFAALAIGLVLALEWGGRLEPFGAKSLMGPIMAVGVVREIGPVMTGLMVAGRTGAMIAAEIGSMKVTEQLSAMRTMGIDPVNRLVMPRQVASMITMLPLTLFADLIAILCGWYVATAWLNMPGDTYWRGIFEALGAKDLTIGFVKPVVFGYMIATVSAHQGMATEGGSSGVGRSATRAVMFSSLSVLIMDFFLSKLIISIYG